ncbi:MAG TPA: MBL fold metallo-hydrolase [Planctomycetota bacterium]|nr:MBL fold metallo-hydrolase [Planctomycetota bacterium]
MRFSLGDLELCLLRTGRFRLDGGAMFGVVAKPLWERTTKPDERNRIPLGLNCVLVRQRGHGDVLVDTGIGDKWDSKSRDIYGVENQPGIVGALAELRIQPAELKHVLNTHLHFDHAGGNTVREADGSVRATFPAARYVVQRGNLEEEARSPIELRRASYLPENFEPIVAAERFDLIEGDREVFPGVKTIVTGGHQKWHQAVLFESRGERAVFLGDIVPTAAHVNPPWIMAYDHYPLDTLAAKKRLLGEAADQGWLCLLEHEPLAPAGRVKRDGAKFRWEPVEGAAA